MGFLDSIRKIASVGAAPLTGGASLLGAGEDTIARIPLVGGFLGAETDSQEALIKKQEELARDAELQKKKNQQMRMQALGQSMLAFNPQNQMMAQMYGPQAAFSPQQMAQMSADPGAMSQEEFSRRWAEAQKGQRDPNQLRQDMGVSQEDLERMQNNQRRMAQVQAQTTPLGPGPAPLRLPPPAAARRY